LFLEGRGFLDLFAKPWAGPGPKKKKKTIFPDSAGETTFLFAGGSRHSGFPRICFSPSFPKGRVRPYSNPTTASFSDFQNPHLSQLVFFLTGRASPRFSITLRNRKVCRDIGKESFFMGESPFGMANRRRFGKQIFCPLSVKRVVRRAPARELGKGFFSGSSLYRTPVFEKNINLTEK